MHHHSSGGLCSTHALEPKQFCSEFASLMLPLFNQKCKCARMGHLHPLAHVTIVPSILLAANAPKRCCGLLRQPRKERRIIYSNQIQNKSLKVYSDGWACSAAQHRCSHGAGNTASHSTSPPRVSRLFALWLRRSWSPPTLIFLSHRDGAGRCTRRCQRLDRKQSR